MKWMSDPHVVKPVSIFSTSGITIPEEIKLTKLQKFPSLDLDAVVSKTFCSPKPARFRFDQNTTENNGGNNTEADKWSCEKEGSKLRAVKAALDDVGIVAAPNIAIRVEPISNTGIFQPGWAYYPKMQHRDPIKKASALALYNMWEHGNKEKVRKLFAEIAQSL